jgi:hypothetical protein
MERVPAQCSDVVVRLVGEARKSAVSHHWGYQLCR